MVPMRDGVRLATDIYFPIGAGDKLPVILMRTPYDKRAGFTVTDALMFAGQGYVAVAQDVRGKYESEGEYIVSAADSKDGYDAVSWAATQPWSSGKVGRYGCSYLGENQIEEAKERNPYLAAMVPKAAGGASLPTGLLNWGGAFELASGFPWFRERASKVRYHAPAGTPRRTLVQMSRYINPEPVVPDIDYRAAFKTLPLIDMMKIVGGPPTDFEDWVSHGPGDPWWEPFGYVTATHRFDVPALHVDSWYEVVVAQTLFHFNLFRTNVESTRGRDHQYVIISPTTHCASEGTTERTVVGSRDLGDARLDYFGIYLRWFDYWLKGLSNGVLGMPKVQIYVMGRNQWRGESEWPLARTRYTKYYLHSDGRANTRLGTGTLSTAPPAVEPPDRYTYDPATPVPSVGGQIYFNPDILIGAHNQSDVEMRHDVLVYTTPVLAAGVEITGPLRAVLYVSSSARDTDFTAKLVDVYPDGTAYNVQEGMIRARYREGLDRRVWMRPGEVYPVTIDLQVTSNYFGPGHRIRLEVSSSNFPRWDRNLNTGGNNYDERSWVMAHNTIHHSARYPSHIVLPIVP